jgi:hypothetical protein
MSNYPLSSYKIKKDNIKLFIEASDPDMRPIVRKVIASTTHISFEKFISLLYKNLKHFIDNNKDNHRPMFFYIDNVFREYIYKSAYWLYELIKQYIHKYNPYLEMMYINSLDTVELQDDDNIFVIDDCIYSGKQLSSTVEDMINVQEKQLNIWIFVPFISHEGLELITLNFKKNPTLKTSNMILPHFVKYINPLSYFMTEQELHQLSYYYGIYKDVYPIYFDHKLADSISTLTAFYSGFAPSEKNKQLFAERRKLITKKMQAITNVQKQQVSVELKNIEIRFDVFPLIGQCHNMQRNFDFMSPQCPMPPYKKDYKSFIKDLSKSVKIIKST